MISVSVKLITVFNSECCNRTSRRRRCSDTDIVFSFSTEDLSLTVFTLKETDTWCWGSDKWNFNNCTCSSTNSQSLVMKSTQISFWCNSCILTYKLYDITDGKASRAAPTPDSLMAFTRQRYSDLVSRPVRVN